MALAIQIEGVCLHLRKKGENILKDLKTLHLLFLTANAFWFQKGNWNIPLETL